MVLVPVDKTKHSTLVARFIVSMVQVQSAVKKAGQDNGGAFRVCTGSTFPSVVGLVIQLRIQDALSDPAVQAQILKVAQEKFPEAHVNISKMCFP